MLVIVGMGVDIVEVDRLEAALSRWGEPLLARLFSPGEYRVMPGPRSRGQFFAGRFAAKEAVLKALGVGLRGCRWRDVEVGRDNRGRPVVRLQGPLVALAAKKGVGSVHLSISHSRRYAVATAVAVRG